MKQKKKNIAVGAFFRLLFPTSLWTRQFFWAWIGCFATVIAFDILWCAQTTFRAFGFIGTYVNAATMATLLAMPVVIIRRPWLQMLVLALVDVLMLANLSIASPISIPYRLPAICLRARYSISIRLLPTHGDGSTSLCR